MITIGALTAYTVEELAVILQLQKKTVRQMIRDGAFPATKLGVRWYVTEQAVQAYLNSPQNTKDAPAAVPAQVEQIPAKRKRARP